MITRRQFIGGLAGLVLGSTIAVQSYSEQPKQFPDAFPQYSQEQLKPPIWPKEMSEKERKDTVSYYNLLTPEEKIAFKEIFSNPKDYMKKTFKTEIERKNFQDDFNIELMGIPKKERDFMERILDDTLKNRYPWKSSARTIYNPKINDDYTLSRRLWEYYEDKESEENQSQKEIRMPKWYSEMTPQEIKDSKRYWRSLKPAEKKRMTEVFSDPKGYIKKYFDRKEQKDFQDYFFSPDATEMSEEEITKLNQYESRFPWKNDIKRLCNPKIDDNYTNAKRLMEYLEAEDFEKDGEVDTKTKK